MAAIEIEPTQGERSARAQRISTLMKADPHRPEPGPEGALPQDRAGDPLLPAAAAPPETRDAGGAEGADDDEASTNGDEAPPARDGSPSLWELLRDSYLTLDRRTLGFTRILLGFFLIADLGRRTWAWTDMFADTGVLPNQLNLWRWQGNFSLLNAFSTSGELWVLWAVILATYVGLLVGFKTKLMQVLSLVFVTSMNGRILLIENGGYTVHNLLLLWTCFLPLGDRFSVDALLASLQRDRERTAADLNDRSALDDPAKPNAHVTALGAVLLIQLAAIYFFNVVHKKGVPWKNGTAVHFVLYVDRMVTPIVAAVRDYAPNWSILFMTRMVLAFEVGIPTCLLSPLGRAWSRRFAIVMMNVLHLGFGSVFVLGPFAWALCIFSTLLLGHEDWELAIRTMKRAHRARVVLFDPRAPGVFFACRLLKRMDRFELLTFEASRSAAHGLAVMRPHGEDPRGETVTGAEALADLVAAIPLGPTVAWVFRLPVARTLTTAAMAAMADRSAGAVFGLRLPVDPGIAPPPSPLRQTGRRALAGLREAGILVMFVAETNQAGTQLWAIRDRWKIPQPEPLRALAQKLRFEQGWYMFCPNPVMDDGTLVIDAVTVDDRHVDPFTGREPDFDLLHAKSYGYSQIWSDYFARIHLPANSAYRDALKEYLLRYPQRSGRPEDAIVSGDVYWVKDLNPRWNTTESYGEEREKLFSFQGPSARPQASNP